MADKKFTELNAITAANQNDILPIVSDPEGTPSAKKITVKNLLKTVESASLSSDKTHTAKDIYQFTAASTMNFGDVCYINSSSKLDFADASAASSSIIAAMCVSTSEVSADATGNYIIDDCIIRNDAWNWTAGGMIYLSTTGTTGNTLTQTAPSGDDETVVPVGVAITADIIIFRPSMAIVEVSA